MKRDMELIRLLLLHLESGESLKHKGYSETEINYDAALAIEAGLIKGEIMTPFAGVRNFSCITPCSTTFSHDYVRWVLIADSSSRKAGNSWSASTIKRPASLRSAATTKIDRPLPSVVVIEPQFHPALRGFPMMFGKNLMCWQGQSLRTPP